MEGPCRMIILIFLTCLVFGMVCGYERRVLRSLVNPTGDLQQTSRLYAHALNYGRVRRQAPPFPSSSRDSDDQFIPRIAPPPPGSTLTYDGKPISNNIGAFNIVPKSERRTPSINRNRPQYATFRGDLPPPIPDVIPRDLPQFKSGKSVVSSVPPGFRN